MALLLKKKIVENAVWREGGKESTKKKRGKVSIGTYMYAVAQSRVIKPGETSGGATAVKCVLSLVPRRG